MPTRPRVGFLGTGWIGRHRMQAMLATGVVEAAAICDPSDANAALAAEAAPAAVRVATLEALLDLAPDGVVIATPSALHAAQATAALERGAAVFCQKPLGRTEAEVRAVTAAARAAGRLLAVDLSYRFTEAMTRIREQVRSGALGRVYAADLVFHNAYGPDKPWFRDPALSGGGCVMDLGVHLVDLALWTLAPATVAQVSADLFAQGTRLGPRPDRVEDHAVATLGLDGGRVVRLACSWNLSAGCDAVISASFYGTEGAAVLHNVGGSFYDFAAEHHRGTASEVLSAPPDAWGGRAAAHWAKRLAAGGGFDPAVEELGEVARALDRIYGR